MVEIMQRHSLRFAVSGIYSYDIDPTTPSRKDLSKRHAVEVVSDWCDVKTSYCVRRNLQAPPWSRSQNKVPGLGWSSAYDALVCPLAVDGLVAPVEFE